MALEYLGLLGALKTPGRDCLRDCSGAIRRIRLIHNEDEPVLRAWFRSFNALSIAPAQALKAFANDTVFVSAASEALAAFPGRKEFCQDIFLALAAIASTTPSITADMYHIGLLEEMRALARLRRDPILRSSLLRCHIIAMATVR